MTAEERLAEFLDEREAEITQLRARIEHMEGAEGWRVPSELAEPQVLPVPRLEIVWTAGGCPGRWIASSFLVYRHLLGHAVALPLGRTISEGGRNYRPDIGPISLPFRDGAHLIHDAEHLKLPAYVTCGERSQEVKRGDGL